MKLHGNNPRASRSQLLGDDARTRSDINDEIACADAGLIDEPTGPTLIELVPSPAPVGLGHGRPSPLSWPEAWPMTTTGAPDFRRHLTATGWAMG